MVESIIAIVLSQVSRGFDLSSFGSRFDRPRWHSEWNGWPHLELSETDSELKVSAELPGLDEKDVEVELTNGILVIKGERKTELEDKDRWFSERSRSITSWSACSMFSTAAFHGCSSTAPSAMRPSRPSRFSIHNRVPSPPSRFATLLTFILDRELMRERICHLRKRQP